MPQDHRKLDRRPVGGPGFLRASGRGWWLAFVVAFLVSTGFAEPSGIARRRRGATRKTKARAAAVLSETTGDAASGARATGSAPPPEIRAAAGPKRKGVSSAGGVVFVTDKRAYLDRGASDGMAPKQTIQLYRGGRAAGSCTIEALGDHQASCAGARARVGDSFRLPTTAASKSKAAVPALPPVVAEAELASRAAAIAEVPFDKVEFSGVRAIAGHAHAQVSPGMTIWRTDPDPSGDYAVVQIDGAVRVTDLAGTGASFDAAFSAMRWNARAANGRFETGTQSQFFLWEAEVSKRRIDGATTFAVGRIWPWHTPGLTLLDGVQLGRQTADGSAEVGVYGGMRPTTVGVAPSAASWAAGAYGTMAQTGSAKRLFRLAREEARLGITEAPGTGLVTELEALAQAWVGVWNVAGSGRVIHAAALGAGPLLDRATLDVGTRATEKLGVGVHVRYFGAALPDFGALTGITPAAGSVSASATLHFDPRPWLGLAASGGGNQDRQSDRRVGYAAAEVRLPRLLGTRGGVSGGAELDQGWLSAQVYYGQLAARFGEGLRLLARASFSATAFTAPSTSPNMHEAGLYLHLDGAFTSWLRLRGWTMLRVPVFLQGELPTEATFGVAGGLTLTGAF